jgi:hypothetical protein
MAQQIYPIQLLNDLHNHFPELLYNPEGFHNVQDVLLYIREVAEMTPYQRGFQQYNSIRVNRTNTAPPVNTIPPQSTTAVPVGGSPLPQTFVTMFSEEIPNTRVRMTNNNNALLNTLLGGLFGDILGAPTVAGGGLHDFLNQRVPVYPTNQEIDNATTSFRAQRRQDDICAICQDEIEINQTVRRINHCTHSFHQDCIDTWFRGNVHCPTCRHDIRDTAVQNNVNRTNSQNSIPPPPVPENYRRMNIRRPDNN